MCKQLLTVQCVSALRGACWNSEAIALFSSEVSQSEESDVFRRQNNNSRRLPREDALIFFFAFLFLSFLFFFLSVCFSFNLVSNKYFCSCRFDSFILSVLSFSFCAGHSFCQSGLSVGSISVFLSFFLSFCQSVISFLLFFSFFRILHVRRRIHLHRRVHGKPPPLRFRLPFSSVS